jgi:hypothetical protein
MTLPDTCVETTRRTGTPRQYLYFPWAKDFDG